MMSNLIYGRVLIASIIQPHQIVMSLKSVKTPNAMAHVEMLIMEIELGSFLGNRN